MNRESKEEYKEFLEDMTCEYCEPKRYCILKEFLTAAHTSPRLLMQLKAIDHFKYFKSKKEGQDIGWAKSMELWVEEGHAKKFAEVYEEDMKFKALYKKIMSE